MKEKILLIGGGGHSSDIIETIRLGKRYEPAGILELKSNIGKKLLGVPVLGEDADMPKWRHKGIKHAFIAIGAIAKPALRIRLADLAKKAGFSFPNIIHPQTRVAGSAVFGGGNYVGPFAVINAETLIGDHCIINSGSIIEHHCKLGDFVHVAPGVTFSGGVVVGARTHIGTGATSIQYLEIGSDCVIGAGSVVVKNIPPRSIAYGNPCKRRKANAW